MTESKEHEEEVFLRVYDLSSGVAKLFSAEILGFQVDGIWHTSIEVFGNEYYFQGDLEYQRAGTTMFNPCIERMSLGFTTCTADNLHDLIENARHIWSPESYDLLENNCNNFTNWLANFLVDKNIPDHILDLPKRVKDTQFFRMMRR